MFWEFRIVISGSVEGACGGAGEVREEVFMGGEIAADGG